MLRGTPAPVGLQRLSSRASLIASSLPSVQDKAGWSRNSNTVEVESPGRYRDERPVHTVTIRTVEMTRSEVTVAQYRACVAAGGCTEPSTAGGCNWGQAGRDDHPVTCVDWNQASAFALWAGGPGRSSMGPISLPASGWNG